MNSAAITLYEQIFNKTNELTALSALMPNECEVLFSLCADVPKDGLVVEVGSQLGRSSSLIEQAKKLRGYRSLHIDPYTDQPEYAKGWVEMMLKVNGKDHAFTLLCMRTEQAEWYLSKLCDEGIDLAFIDGDHLYDAVRIDMALVASRVKSGGFLAAHDYTRPEYPGVQKAIDEFTALGGWKFWGKYEALGVWQRL